MNKEALKELRQRLGLTQEELADMSGLSLVTIKSLETGARMGNDGTWDKIEQAIQNLTSEVTIVGSDGKQHKILVKGETIHIYQMLAICTELNLPEETVLNYLASMESMWQELIDSQKDITNSEEETIYDKNCLNVLRKVAHEQLQLPNLAKHFKTWLGVKES